MRTMPRLHIEKQDAQIGIRTTNARLQVNSRRPKMHINNETPTMKADRKQPNMSVDWQRVRSESGLPGVITRTKQIAGESKQQALNYAGQSAGDGDYYASVEMGGNRVAALEGDRSFDAMKEINLGSMPQSMPNVQWEPGAINISWNNTQMQVEWDSEYMPSFSVEPHSVEIFLRNRPYIRITVTEEPVVAGHVDAQV